MSAVEGMFPLRRRVISQISDGQIDPSCVATAIAAAVLWAVLVRNATPLQHSLISIPGPLG
jgi:hypothetical protein